MVIAANLNAGVILVVTLQSQLHSLSLPTPPWISGYSALNMFNQTRDKSTSFDLFYLLDKAAYFES